MISLPLCNAVTNYWINLQNNLTPGPGRFLVVLRRGHYFGEDLPQGELDRMICLEVASPNPSSAKYPVFIPRDTELGRLALQNFDWDKTYTPIVELAHANRHLALNAIVEETWRRGAR